VRDISMGPWLISGYQGAKRRYKGPLSLSLSVSLSLSLSAPCRTQQKVAICQPGRELSPETEPCQTLTLNIQSSELWENEFLLVKSSSLRHLLQQPQLLVDSCLNSWDLWSACHILNSVLVYLVSQSSPTLCNPMNSNPTGSSVHGIFRQEDWRVSFPSPKHCSNIF